MTNAEPLGHPVVRACRHDPPCPAADAIDHAAARVTAIHPEQGWSLLCNGVITFDDTGELLPDGTSIEPHPAQPPRRNGASPACGKSALELREPHHAR
jgi:Family of unknown function (DUF5999)